MLQSPLAVHLSGTGGESFVEVDDLTFSRNARGGFESATFDLPAWVNSDTTALAPEARCIVYDSRNANVVWEGFLGQAGRTVDEQGHKWQIGAVGAQTVLSDRAKAYIVVDTDLNGWARKYTGAPGATASVAGLPGDEDTGALLMQFPAGLPIGNNTIASMQYDRIANAGQRIGGFKASRIAGFTSVTDFRAQHVVRPPAVVEVDSAWDTTAAGPTSRVVGTHFDTAQTAVTLRINHATGGATNITTDDRWNAFYDIVVRALLKDVNGTDITGSTYTDAYVLAHEVVVDALQWFTNQIDVAGSSIDTTFTAQIDQLAYPDALRLPDVLEDLAAWEPDMIWEVLESGVDGLHKFNLRRWPTVVRYETDSRDGISLSGAESTVPNSLSVFYTDKRGQVQSKPYTTTVDALEQWGRTRDADPVTLGVEMGSLAAADAIGPAVLEQLVASPDSGTLTVDRPVRDLYNGMDVYPWEIEAGYLMNVRDVETIRALPITQMSYSDSAQAATLTFGDPAQSVDQLVTNLSRRRLRHGGGITPGTGEAAGTVPSSGSDQGIPNR